MSFQIQRAKSTEWKSVRAIRLRALSESPDAFSSTLAEEQRLSDADWQERCRSDRVAQFLAVSTDGDLCGIAVGAPYEGEPASAGLFGMWVAPEFRQRGLGVSLVNAVIQWAHDAGYQRLVLDVGDDNRPAVRLYESCGFVPTGIKGTLPAPRQHITEYQLARHLPSPDSDPH